jgi:zinc protease
VPTFTVEIAVKNGAMTEPPELNGLSHLYEHMFFKANAVLPNQEAYLARTRELGILFNGSTMP